MLAGTGAALLAVFAALRRVAGSSLAALALFLPFVATSFFMEVGPLENRYGPATSSASSRSATRGPYVLSWLVVRRVDGARRGAAGGRCSRFAGLVAINNLEFGVPRLGARSRAAMRRAAIAARALALLAGGGSRASPVALALVVAADARASPARCRTSDCCSTFPRHLRHGRLRAAADAALGLHLVVYLTFAAAIVRRGACARARRRRATAADGALAWSGVFGLGVGSYFVGRSHPHVLIDLFSPWALSLALLLVVVVRARRARAPRARPQPPSCSCCSASALAVCSLAQTPTPWSQLERLDDAPARPPRRSGARSRAHVIAGLTRPASGRDPRQARAPHRLRARPRRRRALREHRLDDDARAVGGDARGAAARAGGAS